MQASRSAVDTLASLEHIVSNNNNNSAAGGGVINVRHGCPRCSTCNTLLQIVGQLEQMLQNRGW